MRSVNNVFSVVFLKNTNNRQLYLPRRRAIAWNSGQLRWFCAINTEFAGTFFEHNSLTPYKTQKPSFTLLIHLSDTPFSVIGYRFFSQNLSQIKRICPHWRLWKRGNWLHFKIIFQLFKTFFFFGKNYKFFFYFEFWIDFFIVSDVNK